MCSTRVGANSAAFVRSLMEKQSLYNPKHVFVALNELSELGCFSLQFPTIRETDRYDRICGSGRYLLKNTYNTQ